MTTQPGAAPTDGAPASEITKPLRELAALVLLGANAVFMFVALLRLLFSDTEFTAPFTLRAAGSFDGFVSLTTIALPIVAVLLATHVRPAVRRAKLITLIALVEYAVAAFFGVLFGVLIGLVALMERSVWLGFLTLLVRLAWLAVLGVAAYAVFKLWRTLYYVPKPKPQPGVYGQPHPYGQPGYPQQYGAPQGGHPQGYPYGQPGYPAPPYGQSGAPGQPQFGAPYPGAPQSFPPAPQSAPPAPHAAPPAQPGAAPVSTPPAAEPTQSIPVPPQPTGDGETGERTQVIKPLGAQPGGEQPSGSEDDGQRTQVIKPEDPR
ncbi:hypothetical protein SAMN05444365_103253 [Micromonospora pattaloongensis]|uniref:Uncharacterized protein n=1 Tax=Micromonospora pattaloongensis TaxID=405436 RepID=A0A1H3M6C9_9ACTN|nr:hypothetical protein [Micromonospora pattaloongensis]SDY72287.1 hypothetical protein SAMN05444365_103253 [Micromonospora pattaloongensis]